VRRALDRVDRGAVQAAGLLEVQLEARAFARLVVGGPADRHHQVDDV
jgi:hypothetical protein